MEEELIPIEQGFYWAQWKTPIEGEQRGRGWEGLTWVRREEGRPATGGRRQRLRRPKVEDGPEIPESNGRTSRYQFSGLASPPNLG